MHRDDPEPHEDGRRADPRNGGRPGARGEHRSADDDHADEERNQRRQDEVVDRERRPLGQHADEMHRPDAERQANGGAGKKRPLPRPLRARHLNGEAQPDIGSLNRQRDGKRDKPGRV